MSDIKNNRGLAPSRGMVLIAVLWMVMALGIIVTGITRSVRDESRMMALARQSIEATAAGDAVIQIVLQDMVSRPVQINRLEHRDISYRGVSIPVQVMPLNGLVDINSAGVPLLSSLYAIAGEVPESTAAILAQATVDTRQRRDSKGAPARFEAEEDLLQVPGVDYTLYARLSGLVTADLRGQGKINPLAAPIGVLAVLAGGNTLVATRIAADRDAGVEGIDTTALDAALMQTTPIRRFQIQARLPMPDGSWFKVFRNVDLNVRGRDGMPWHTFHSGHSIEPRSPPTS